MRRAHPVLVRRVPGARGSQSDRSFAHPCKAIGWLWHYADHDRTGVPPVMWDEVPVRVRLGLSGIAVAVPVLLAWALLRWWDATS